MTYLELIDESNKAGWGPGWPSEIKSYVLGDSALDNNILTWAWRAATHFPP